MRGKAATAAVSVVGGIGVSAIIVVVAAKTHAAKAVALTAGVRAGVWECLTACCKVFSLANGKGTDTNDWVIKSLDD